MFTPPIVKPAIPAVVWLAQPSADDIARVAAYGGAGGASRNGKGKMRCYVAADGRLDGCRVDEAKSDPAYRFPLLSLNKKYRLDTNVKDVPRTIDVEVVFNKQYDQAPRLLSSPGPAEATSPKIDHLSGLVYLTCKVLTNGNLEACEPSPAYDHDPKRDRAALSLTPSYRYQPALLNGSTVEAWEPVTVQLGPHEIKMPDWIKRPGSNDFADSYPDLAQRSGLSGRATMRCSVNADGTLKDCVIESESPAGVGFGNAVLAMSSKFKLKPEMIDGRPSENGYVTIPVSFKTAAGSPTSTSRVGNNTFKLLPWLPWTHAPSAQDYANAYPPTARANNVEGHVGLMCDIVRSGQLTSCDVNSETPDRAGFGKAALKLVPFFQTSPDGLKGFDISSVKVALNFDFSSRTLEAPAQHFVRRPNWVRTVDGADMEAVYPTEAVKEGVFGGQVVIDCSIGVMGALEACAVSKETPTGLGFGAAAVKVAPIMQANLWTQDGEPAAGQKIRLPMRFIYSGPAEPTGAAKPASPPAL